MKSYTQTIYRSTIVFRQIFRTILTIVSKHNKGFSLFILWDNFCNLVERSKLCDIFIVFHSIHEEATFNNINVGFYKSVNNFFLILKAKSTIIAIATISKCAVQYLYFTHHTFSIKLILLLLKLIIIDCISNHKILCLIDINTFNFAYLNDKWFIANSTIKVCHNIASINIEATGFFIKCW